LINTLRTYIENNNIQYSRIAEKQLKVQHIILFIKIILEKWFFYTNNTFCKKQNENAKKIDIMIFEIT